MPKPIKLTRPAVSRLLLAAAFLCVLIAGMFLGILFETNREGLDMAQFWQVYRLVQQNYVGSVDKTKAVQGATAGLVDSLGDPFSQYLTSSQKQDLNTELSGQFEGIGAELTTKNSVPTVVAPLAGSPAEKAGLKPNDIIVKVDDKSVEGLSLDEVVNKIRGPKGSSVKLSVQRGEATQLQDFTITRDDISVPSVSSKMIGNVAYLSITQFGDDTVTLAQQQVKDLTAKNPKALIIDLRDNPGGYLNDVSPIAGLFLPPSIVVKEKYRSGKEDVIRSTDIPVMPNTPIYVLVNGGSASAAEILSGALQDYKRATLIGQKTFGKGSVQDVIDLPGNTGLRITIAEWLTPKDRAINKVGIEPDVKVTGDKTDTSDPVLDKALELAQK